jgi:2-hydroxy-4-carboxymuconate semialdehyde hemiacetal dehydrogenase
VTKPLNVALVGMGAIGAQHLEAFSAIDDARVVAIAGGEPARLEALAASHGIGAVRRNLDEVLALPQVEAIVLCTPTPLHAQQAVQCLDAGRHVLVEIPVADSLAGALAVEAARQRSGLVAMAAHTRRFNPGHRCLHARISDGAFRLRQLDVQTYFLRRSNANALGQPRDWADHLLWHHAAHSVDLFQYQCPDAVQTARVLQGPLDPALGIALDMSIQMRSRAGALCTLSLSFNHRGPHGSTFRYIGDAETFVVRYDALTDGAGAALPLPDDLPGGMVAQGREFVAAIRQGRTPEAAVQSVLPCYRLLDELERALAAPGEPAAA